MGDWQEVVNLSGDIPEEWFQEDKGLSIDELMLRDYEDELRPLSVLRFDSLKDAQDWARENPGQAITRSPDGKGFVPVITDVPKATNEQYVAEILLPQTAKHGSRTYYFWFYAESKESAHVRAAHLTKVLRKDCRLMWVKRPVPEIPKEDCGCYVELKWVGVRGRIQRVPPLPLDPNET